jgi:hypothetical protein
LNNRLAVFAPGYSPFRHFFAQEQASDQCRQGFFAFADTNIIQIFISNRACGVHGGVHAAHYRDSLRAGFLGQGYRQVTGFGKQIHHDRYADQIVPAGRDPVQESLGGQAFLVGVNYLHVAQAADNGGKLTQCMGDHMPLKRLVSLLPSGIGEA